MSYEVLYTDYLSNCEEGDLIRFPWIDEDGDPMQEQVDIKYIDVDSTIVIKGYSHITGETTTYEITDDPEVEVLGG